MAFFGKVGNILRQTASKQLSSDLSLSNPSVFQAIRCMSSKVFVGGLSYGTDETSLREEFSKYGEVVDSRVIMDRESGRSRGFGFITYASSEDASTAIQALDGQDLHGRRIRVNYATDRAPRAFGGGGYGGQGGYGGGDGSYNPSFGQGGGYGENQGYGGSQGYGGGGNYNQAPSYGGGSDGNYNPAPGFGGGDGSYSPTPGYGGGDGNYNPAPDGGNFSFSGGDAKTAGYGNSSSADGFATSESVDDSTSSANFGDMGPENSMEDDFKDGEPDGYADRRG